MRICYCVRCNEGEKEIFNKFKDSEEYNGLADFHFKSTLDPRWDSFEWSIFNFIMTPEHHIDRVIKIKQEKFGNIPADLEIHSCEGLS